MAFEPPSDYAPEESSSGKKKLWVGLGIGCAIILLIIGGIFIFGGFKAVSCCSQLKESTEKSMKARQFSLEFANLIYEGNLTAAYDHASEEFRKDMSLENFREAVESHREKIKAGPPRLFNMHVISTGEEGFDIQQWKMSMQYAGPSSEDMLLMHLRVAAQGEDNQKMVVEDVSFEMRERRLEHEPPAVAVLELHGEIQQGRYEQAYQRLSPEFVEKTDVETFKKFLREQGDVLTNSQLEIRRVEYSGPDRATVVAHADAKSGKQAIVQYELKAPFPGAGVWQVMTISPMIAAEEPEKLPESGDADAGAPAADSGAD